MIAFARSKSQAPDARTKCAVHTRCYRNGELVDEGFAAERISDYLADGSSVVWLDLLDPDHAELSVVTEELGLHPLAIEDAINERQRPKVDHYDSHLFLNAYDLALNVGTGELRRSEISAFVTDRALVTVRKDRSHDILPVIERWDTNVQLAGSGVAFLLWGLLDHIGDNHFVVVQTMEEAIEELEDAVFDEASSNRAVQRRTFALRKSLARMRRVAVPMPDVIDEMHLSDLEIVDVQMRPYFQDVKDHALRVSDLTESMRDSLQSVLDANLNIQSYRLNEVMKQLTAWAAIIAVPTAITGFYGQNVPYPGFQHRSGFVASMTLMVAIAGGLWVLFKRRRWL